MSEVPFVAIGNDELRGRPKLRDGDFVRCPSCGEEHPVSANRSTDGGMTIETYKCGDEVFMAGINGVSTMGMRLSGGIVDL